MKIKIFLTLSIVSILLSATCAGLVQADTFAVGESYNSTDTLTTSDLWHVYTIDATSKQNVKYSVAVQGSGTVLVLFVKGHSFSLSSLYYEYYSADTSVTSYSNDFPVGSDDGTAFSVVVITELLTNVTYNISIEVYNTPASTYLIGGLVLFALLFGCCGIRMLIRRAVKKPAPHIPPAPMQPPQGPPESVQ